jgi:leader peptidase (prepilin peptidase)/N-methyltransferase
VVGVALILGKGKDMRYAVPFGPFLCATAVIHLFFGNCLSGLFFS